MDEIFGPIAVWKDKYRVIWCDHCNCYSIVCPEPSCDGVSCNGSGCAMCNDDFKEFHTLKCSVTDYLNEEERAAYRKAMHLKRLIPHMFTYGDTCLDFKKLQREGCMSKSDELVFENELT
jgi:hypothetical protein